MDPSKLRPGEMVAVVGALLLAISVFLTAYKVDEANPNSNVNGMGGPSAAGDLTRGDGSYSLWQTFGILRFLLLAAAIAPFILAWIIIRDHKLSWPRGEMTAVVGIAAFGLVFYVGIVDNPGENGAGLAFGWFVALVGTILIIVGGAMRSGESERKRKPPGVL